MDFEDALDDNDAIIVLAEANPILIDIMFNVANYDVLSFKQQHDEASCLLSLDHVLESDPGIDVNQRDTLHHYTCLHLASRWGYLQVIQRLLKHPLINVNAVDRWGQTPLMVAEITRFYDVFSLLLTDARVDVMKTGKIYNITVFWSACRRGEIEICRRLIASERDFGDVNTTKTLWDFPPRKGYYTAREATFYSLGFTKDEPSRSGLGNAKLVDLLDEFDRDPTQTRYKVQLDLKFPKALAALLFAIVVFVCDDLLQMKLSAVDDHVNPKRFFDIVVQLPMELQMILCNMGYGLNRETIPLKESEQAFKALTEKLSIQ
jgi:ankyrin repeat protein